MTKYALIGLAILAALAGLWGWGEHQRAGRAVDKVASLEAAVASRDKAITALTKQAAMAHEVSRVRAKEITRLRVKSEAQQKALNEALQANRDWADAPIPSRVHDALTAPADATGPPGPGVDGARPGAPAPGAHERRPSRVGEGPAVSPG